MTKLAITVHHWDQADLTMDTPARAGWYWGIAENGVVETWHGPYPSNETAMNAGNRLVTAAVASLVDGPGGQVAAPYLVQAAPSMLEAF
jgi:hypothetical protein